MLNEIKWATRQRLQYIEIMAFYAGVVTRADVAATFGISDAAATKDLKFYCDIAPENLQYKHTVFGFVPTASFNAVFTDLEPEHALGLLEANRSHAVGPNSEKQVFGIQTETLGLPARYPDKHLLAQITRAIFSHAQLNVQYHSLSNRKSNEQRIIEPHSLVNTGFRWHVRAYNTETYDFRDFVLSRFISAEKLNETAESNEQYDDDWIEMVTLQLSPHPKLVDSKRKTLLLDYGGEDDVIEVRLRRALIGYFLQTLPIDTSEDHSANPQQFQLVLLNRNEIEPYAVWAFQ